MQMISREFVENITNHIMVLLLLGTSLLIRFGDILTVLINKSFDSLHRRGRSYPIK